MSHTEGAYGATTKLKSVLATLAARASADAQARPSQADGSASPDAEDTGPKATLGDLIGALDERAYGLMLLLLALPCCLPFVYILPQIVALPMLALAGQMALGRQSPWLPKTLSEREFPIRTMQTTVERAEKYLGWAEKITHRRFISLSDGIGARIVGALLMIPCASILVPLPLTNTTPGLGVAIAALGLVERDGLLILLGLLIGLVWVFLLVFLGAEAISLAKDWLLSQF
jgi:hypothetical protein